MKRKTITLVIYMLVCISLVSVGFAAWVITGGDNTQATGNVEASVVTDSSITIDDESEGKGFIDKDYIMFGSPNGSSLANAYLTFNGDDKENLSVVYEFDVSSNSGNLADIKTLTAAYTAPAGLSDEDDGDSSLITNKYVSDVSFSCIVKTTVQTTSVKFGENKTEYTSDEDALAAGLLDALNKTTGGSATVRITISYSWGTAFGGVNPYYYYNFSDYATNKTTLRHEFKEEGDPVGQSWSELKDDAWNALDALQRALPQGDSSKTFSLVINISSRA